MEKSERGKILGANVLNTEISVYFGMRQGCSENATCRVRGQGKRKKHEIIIIIIIIIKTDEINRKITRK